MNACSFNPKCINKESFLKGFDEFSKDIEKHYEELNGKDWIDIDKEFKEYVDICYPKFKKDLTIKEKIGFWKHTLSYGLYRGNKAGEYKLDIELDLEQELEEMSQQGREELEQYIRDEIAPELNNVIDEVLKEFDGFGDKLKELLDNI